MSKNKTTLSNIDILFEDNHFIVINKRSGDIVQGDKTSDMPLSEILKQDIKKRYHKSGDVYLGVSHRLDRPVSGTLLFAKTSKGLSRFNKMLVDKKVNKTYWALVQSLPKEKEGMLEHYLKRNTKQNKSYVYPKKVPNSKLSILNYKYIKSLDRYSLLEIKLETGRHHQIRSQLANIGCVIKGDLKYGASRPNKSGGIHLHAVNLSFNHPIKDKFIDISAPLPNDILWNACKKK